MADAEIVSSGESVFQVSGDMTFATAPKLFADSKSLFQQREELTLDLGRVVRADSAGLALLLEWAVQATRRGAKLRVKGIPESLLAIARLCHIENVVEELAVGQENPDATS